VDKFYKFLREIQKKERNKSTLARVDEDFYKSIHDYLDKLRKSASSDPFSNEYNLLKESQMVATEICERREYKITDAAVINIHRSFHLFTGKPKFDLLDTTPINLTPEEEKFYFSLIDSLKGHRTNISLYKLSEDDLIADVSKDNNQKTIIKSDIKSNKKENNISDKETKTKINKSKAIEKDLILENLEKVSKAKIINDEKREPVEKQINKSKKEDISSENISNIYQDIDNQFDTGSSSKKSKNETILIFDDIDPIVGVDEKVYGPFRPQDIVTIPNENAKVFTRYKKARFVKI
jgi:DNA replication factor GINS